VMLLIVCGIASSLSLHLLAVSQQTVGIKPSSFYTIAHAAFPALTSVIDVVGSLFCCHRASHAWGGGGGGVLRYQDMCGPANT
jgi:hypothetical protein